MLKLCCNLSYQMHGERISPAIIASKHQSAFDILILQQEFPNAVFVLKKELLNIPVFGYYLRKLEYIAIDRSSSDAAAQIVEQAKQQIDKGNSIIIFPEGTRTVAGKKVKYRISGLSRLIEALDVPTLPVALNTGIYWPRNSLLKKAGAAQVKLLPAIQDKSVEARTLAKNITEAIEAESMALYKHTHTAL